MNTVINKFTGLMVIIMLMSGSLSVNAQTGTNTGDQSGTGTSNQLDAGTGTGSDQSQDSDTSTGENLTGTGGLFEGEDTGSSSVGNENEETEEDNIPEVIEEVIEPSFILQVPNQLREYRVYDGFVANLMMNTAGEEVIGMHAIVNFDNSVLQFDGFIEEDSVVNLWPDKQAEGANEGKIKLTGGMIGGYSTENPSKIIGMKFLVKAKSASGGIISIDKQSSSIKKNADGVENILKSANILTIAIEAEVIESDEGAIIDSDQLIEIEDSSKDTDELEGTDEIDQEETSIATVDNPDMLESDSSDEDIDPGNVESVSNDQQSENQDINENDQEVADEEDANDETLEEVGKQVEDTNEEGTGDQSEESVEEDDTIVETITVNENGSGNSEQPKSGNIEVVHGSADKDIGYVLTTSRIIGIIIGIIGLMMVVIYFVLRKVQPEL